MRSGGVVTGASELRLGSVSFVVFEVGTQRLFTGEEMSEEPKVKKEITEVDKLVELVQTLVFTFVIALVILEIIGCCEAYNFMESRR